MERDRQLFKTVVPVEKRSARDATKQTQKCSNRCACRQKCGLGRSVRFERCSRRHCCSPRWCTKAAKSDKRARQKLHKPLRLWRKVARATQRSKRKNAQTAVPVNKSAVWAEVCVLSVVRVAIVVRRAGAQKQRKVTNERGKKLHKPLRLSTKVARATQRSKRKNVETAVPVSKNVV